MADIVFSKRTRRTEGWVRGYRRVRDRPSGLTAYLNGVWLFNATFSEETLNRGRFANYKTLPCEHHLEIQITQNGLIARVIPWLRYETKSWNFVAARKGEDQTFFLTIGFAEPKDGILFQLQLENILRWELKPRKSRKYAVTAAALARAAPKPQWDCPF